MDLDRMGIGHALRLHRERRRVSLETISRATLVRREYLELIDADRLDDLPPGAYAKGFIRAYAGFLGLDPRPFVRAYEQRCRQPQPELAEVVRQPLRVPSPAHPRAWRGAAAGGLGLLVLLGLLGVVRSGDHAARPPTPSAAEVAALVQQHVGLPEALSPAPNPAGAVVGVEVVGAQAWVQAEQDGTVAFAGTMRRGQRRTFRGRESVYLVVSNARAVRITANGRDVGTPPGTTYRGTFTPSTTELPPSQPR